MVKIIVDVTNKELNAIEDLAMCWNLCDKHKGIIDASDEECFRFTQTCKKCKKINGLLRNKVMHLWVKLIDGYLKSTKYHEKIKKRFAQKKKN